MAPAVIVGFLHPGAMGEAVATTCAAPTRLWASDGRSPATAARARAAGLVDVQTVEAMARQADVIVSVCPPAVALEQAVAVSAAGFDGLYVDANAVSPETARRIESAVGTFVDGGIIGPPATAPGTTRLYLSGARAHEVATLWRGSVLEARVVAGGAGAASALKMCFAAWTKGTAALLLSIRALAQIEGVDQDLVDEWTTSMPELVARSEHVAPAVAPKAWRFGPEMEQIAATFAAAGLPDGFHLAAAEVYERLASFKDRSPGPSLADVRRALG